MKYKGWKQRVAYIPDSTVPGWWWFCHEKIGYTGNPPVCVVGACSMTSLERGCGGGLVSVSDAIKAALVHRYQCHFRGVDVNGKWERDSERYWYKVDGRIRKP